MEASEHSHSYRAVFMTFRLASGSAIKSERSEAKAAESHLVACQFQVR